MNLKGSVKNNPSLHGSIDKLNVVQVQVGLDTSDATAAASDILYGKTAYVNGKKISGAILPQYAQSYTPGQSSKTIAKGKYLAGDQTIKGDANLVESNIKSGVSIFGVAGSYEGNGGITPSGTKEITANGTHDVTEYANVNVNVPTESEGTTPSGTLNITENGTHDVTNYASAEVNVPVPDGYVKPSGTKAITANGTHSVSGYANVNVSVPSEEPTLQEKTVTANGTVTADSGYDGLSKVTVNVPTSSGGEKSYVLSGSWSVSTADGEGNHTDSAVDINMPINFTYEEGGTTYTGTSIVCSASEETLTLNNTANTPHSSKLYSDGWSGKGTVITITTPYSASETEYNWFIKNFTTYVPTSTEDSPLPTEVATEAEMNAILESATADSVGAVYKYTGTTGTYENGALYIIEAGSDVVGDITITESEGSTDRVTCTLYDGDDNVISSKKTTAKGSSITFDNILTDYYIVVKTSDTSLQMSDVVNCTINAEWSYEGLITNIGAGASVTVTSLSIT